MYLQTTCDFSYCNGNSSCSKIVTFFYVFCKCWVSKQSLKFSFFWCISLLNMGSLLLLCCNSLSVWWYLSSTNSISPCFSKHDHDISLFWWFTADMFTWSSSNDKSTLKSFGNISWMKVFFYLSCWKSYLISITSVSKCSSKENSSLGKFSCKGCWKWFGWIAWTTDSHRLKCETSSTKCITNDSS